MIFVALLLFSPVTIAMPFLARCPFCQKEFRAADTMEGRSVTCKQCGDAFTLARAEPLPAPIPRGPAVVRQSPAAATVPAPELSAEIESSPIERTPPPATKNEKPRVAAVSAAPIVARGLPAPLPALGLSYKAGVLSLCLTGIALVCVSFPVLRWGTLFLGAISLLSGMYGWLTADSGKLRRIWMPLTGAAMSLPVLIIAGFFPQLFAITLPEDYKPPKEDPAKLLAVPFRGEAIDPPAEWLDASRYSLQQGDLRVRIMGAAIDLVELKGERQSRSKQPYLQIRLQVANARVRKRLDYHGWSRSRVDLRDTSGKSYALHSFGPGIEVAGQRQGPVALGPFDQTNDILIFDPPPASWFASNERLRLQLPAEVAGGIGSLKFEIPNAMIQRR